MIVQQLVHGLNEDEIAKLVNRLLCIQARFNKKTFGDLLNDYSEMVGDNRFIGVKLEDKEDYDLIPTAEIAFDYMVCFLPDADRPRALAIHNPDGVCLRFFEITIAGGIEALELVYAHDGCDLAATNRMAGYENLSLAMN